MSLRQGPGAGPLTDREFAAIVTSVAQANKLTFAGVVQASVVLPAVAASLVLPSVVVTSLPTGITITRVIAAVAWRKQVDSSAALNAIDGTQQIQVRADTPGTFLDAITMSDNSLETAAGATEGGLMLLGDSDILAEVDGVGTYEFQWEDALVDGAALTLHDFQTYLIIEFT